MPNPVEGTIDGSWGAGKGVSQDAFALSLNGRSHYPSSPRPGSKSYGSARSSTGAALNHCELPEALLPSPMAVCSLPNLMDSYPKRTGMQSSPTHFWNC